MIIITIIIIIIIIITITIVIMMMIITGYDLSEILKLVSAIFLKFIIIYLI